MALITFLVEDNKTIRDNLVPALEDLVNGRVVGFAETESDALEWLAAHPDDWQLLIVDLFLKEGSGLGVLAGRKSRKPGQRVVVLSNYVTGDIRARCEALGADAVFDKSHDLDAFIEYCNTDRPSGLAAL
ncbi:response regulator [Variovorax sp. EL159]|jgi:DNA-binding NarL/FixJ family response regulator|uniref:response regulator n=1 Tax=unclassified Variovorax TaxID=663243 RepID=UPI000889D4EE|nr:response regulator [Variovorax sp. EL159]SCX64975.1 Response regulator receiver domain-containing protein [Variovorax sp. EL159]